MEVAAPGTSIAIRGIGGPAAIDNPEGEGTEGVPSEPSIHSVLAWNSPGDGIRLSITNRETESGSIDAHHRRRAARLPLTNCGESGCSL